MDALVFFHESDALTADSHDFEMPLFDKNICGGSADTQNVSDFFHHVGSLVGKHFLRAVLYLRHDCLLS